MFRDGTGPAGIRRAALLTAMLITGLLPGAGSVVAPVMPVAQAAALTVTSTADDGTLGTLRYAVAHAADGDTITFDPGLSGTIILTGSLVISQDLTIAGPGAGTLAVDAAGASRVFIITC